MGTLPTLAQLLADAPLLHHDGSGAAVSWQLNDKALSFIDANIGEGSQTLETGEGLSTVLFALRGTEHVCVSPNTLVHENIRRFCMERGINLDRVRFEVGFSQDVLPRLEPTPLDLVLIDGGHGFPIPFVDWLYTAGRLRVGGYLIVDDTQLWTAEVLKRFISEEPEWQLVEDFPPRSAIFRRTAEGNHAKEWLFQPYVVRASRRGDWLNRFKRGTQMLASGDLHTFRRRFDEYFLRRR